MLAASQREQGFKFEIVVPIASDEPTAICSFNYHQEHFGKLFEISLPEGSPAHTACLGFGLERVTLALFRRHGLDPREWPATVQAALDR
jgi:seryl-tRNA synthetase